MKDYLVTLTINTYEHNYQKNKIIKAESQKEAEEQGKALMYDFWGNDEDEINEEYSSEFHLHLNDGDIIECDVVLIDKEKHLSNLWNTMQTEIPDKLLQSLKRIKSVRKQENPDGFSNN